MADLRWAVRGLMKSPGFALAAVATLALGIGAAVLVWAVLYPVVLKPLPYREPERLVFLWIDDVKRGIHEEGAGYPTYLEWKAQATSFEDIAVRGRGYSLNLAGPEPERLLADVVSANFFSVLGVAPAAGRVFTSEQEERGELVAVISQRLALRRFGTMEAAVGKPLEFEGRIWRVTGVMPPRYGMAPYRQDLWLPARKLPALERFIGRRDWDYFMGVARLKAGKTAAEAQSELNVIGARLAVAYPNDDPEFGGYGVAVVPFDRQILGRRLPSALWMLMGAVGLVLLISCVNIANLLLARGAARRTEFAIRNALGAGVARLVSQQMWEGALLALVGGAVGLCLALAGLRVIPFVAPADLPRFDDLRPGTPVVLFAVLVSAAACAVFGLVPACLHARNALPAPAARVTGGGTGRLQSALIVAEFALALVLLAGAGVFLKSLVAVERTPPGYDARRLLLFQIELDENRPGKAAFYRDLLERLRTLPGVEAAGAITDFFIERNPDQVVTVQGRATSDHEQVTVDAVTAGFLEAAGARLIDGRHLTEADYQRPRPATVVVNETFARRLFPGQRAVGQHLKFGTADARGPWIEVVGVVADLRRRGLETAAVCEAFGPVVGSSLDVIVRTSVKPEAVAAAVRETIGRVDAGASMHGMTTVEAKLSAFAAERRLETWLLAGFSLLALLLAGVGIFGLMQYTVGMRRREIAIRSALGELAGRAQARVIGQGLMWAGAGIATGWALTAAAGGMVQAMLYGVAAWDPWSLGAASLVLAMVAAAACWMPARSAAKTAPSLLMRE